MASTSSANNYFLCILGLVLVSVVSCAYAAGECPNSSPDREAFKLLPCAPAAKDVNAPVPESCCAQVKRIGQNPKCLCAIVLSNTAKMSGVNSEIALTIPKRCNLVDRPVGYKCGSYTLPRI